jgi:hypothetical protein
MSNRTNAFESNTNHSIDVMYPCELTRYIDRYSLDRFFSVAMCACVCMCGVSSQLFTALQCAFVSEREREGSY